MGFLQLLPFVKGVLAEVCPTCRGERLERVQIMGLGASLAAQHGVVLRGILIISMRVRRTGMGRASPADWQLQIYS